MVKDGMRDLWGVIAGRTGAIIDDGPLCVDGGNHPGTAIARPISATGPGPNASAVPHAIMARV